MTEEIMEQPAEEIREETVPETTEEVEDAAITAAYEAGRAAAALESDARIAALEEQLKQAHRAAARRETEIRCGTYLRERGLSEEMASCMIFSSSISDMSDMPWAAMASSSAVISSCVSGDAKSCSRSGRFSGEPVRSFLFSLSILEPPVNG